MLAAVVVVASLRPAGWNVTVLPRVGAHTPLAAVATRIDPGFRLVPHGGYDGQFYWAVALDPLATNDVHAAVDKPTYRYGHPLLGWLGWLLSGGRGGAAAGALLAAGLLSLAAAAAAAAALGRRFGRGWAALATCCNAGVLYATGHALAEPLALALLFGALLAYAADRPRLAFACCALLPLAKEQLLVVPLALAAWEVRQTTRRRIAAGYVLTLVPSVVWWTAMRIHLGAWFTTGDTALGAPFAGWRRAILDAGVSASSGTDEATLVVLAALLGLLLVAGVAALRLRTPADAIFVLLGLLALCLAPNATVSLRDALRNTSYLVALIPFVAGVLEVRRAAALGGDPGA